MSRMQRLISFLGMILIVLALPSAANASCASSTTEERLNRNEIAFLGQLSQHDQQKVVTAEGLIHYVDVVRYQVSAVYKGRHQAEYVVEYPLYPDESGFTFREGKSYMVFASQRDGKWVSSPCQGTSRALSVQGMYDLVQLSKSTVLTMAIVLTLAGFAWFWRRRARAVV